MDTDEENPFIKLLKRFLDVPFRPKQNERENRTSRERLEFHCVIRNISLRLVNRRQVAEATTREHILYSYYTEVGSTLQSSPLLL